MTDNPSSEEQRITRLAFVTLPRSFQGDLERLAVRDNRSVDEVISLIVEGYLYVAPLERPDLFMDDDIPF